jgi:hypothetical protein
MAPNRLPRHERRWQVSAITSLRQPERVIGSIRRECLDHIVIFNEGHLRRVLSGYVDYYHRTRTHLSLDKDCPDPRAIQPRSSGKVIAIHLPWRSRLNANRRPDYEFTRRSSAKDTDLGDS